MKNIVVPALVTRARTPLAMKVGSFVVLAALVATAAACSVNATDDNPGVDTSGACSTDSSLACVTGTQGYTCSGVSQPEDADPGLVCSTDNGAGSFCCSTSSCNYDSTLSCGGATGYSCASGATAPDAADSSLVCSVAATANGVDTYCCYTNTDTGVTGATCDQDESIVGCEENADGTPSYGFSCTGTDTPDQDFSNITCSTPTANDNGLQNYCCVYN